MDDEIWFNLEEKLPVINKEVFIKFSTEQNIKLMLIGKLTISVSRGKAYFLLPYNDQKILLLKEVNAWAKIPKDYFKVSPGAEPRSKVLQNIFLCKKGTEAPSSL